MTKINEIYHCSICGNIISVFHDGPGVLSCCDQTMSLLKSNTIEASLEKHIPVFQKTKKGFKIQVGSIPHPMEEKHFIEWLEFAIEDKIIRKQFRPGEKAELIIECQNYNLDNCKKDNPKWIRAYCNLHGLWKS